MTKLDDKPPKTGCETVTNQPVEFRSNLVCTELDEKTHYRLLTTPCIPTFSGFRAHSQISQPPLFLQGETHAYKTQVSQLERLSYHTGSQISSRITRCELDDKYWHSMTKKHSMITVTLDDKLAEVNKTSSKKTVTLDDRIVQFAPKSWGKTVTLGDKSGSLRLRPTWNICSARCEIHN